MSEGGTIYDDPNREVVRPDSSPAWEEGDGGSVVDQPAGRPVPERRDDDYDSMTKAELIDLARERGISPANADMSKAELMDALEA